MAVTFVLILQPDSISAEAFRRRILKAYPDAICHVANTIESAESALLHGRIDLFITGAETVEHDVLDLLLLCRCRGRSALRTIVTTNRKAARLLVTLRELGVSGVYDVVSERPEQLEHALRTVDAGRPYWSPTIKEHFAHPDCRIVSHQLSATEQLGLAILGDGCGDDDASGRLNLTTASVRSLRRNLHAKLGMHDRRDTVRCAAQLGYTRFTSEGVVAFGLAILVLEYLTRCKRPVDLPIELLALCRIGPDGIVPPARTPRSSRFGFTLK